MNYDLFDLEIHQIPIPCNLGVISLPSFQKQSGPNGHEHREYHCRHIVEYVRQLQIVSSGLEGKRGSTLVLICVLLRRDSLSRVSSKCIRDHNWDTLWCFPLRLDRTLHY